MTIINKRSPSVYLNPQTFPVDFSHLPPSWKGEGVREWLGGHLAASQGQFTAKAWYIICFWIAIEDETGIFIEPKLLNSLSILTGSGLLIVHYIWIFTSLRGGPMGTSWSVRSCSWSGTVPSTNTGCAENGLRAGLRRRLMWPSKVHLQPGKPNVFWAASEEPWPNVREVILSFCSILRRIHMESVFSSGTPSVRTWTCWSECSGGAKKMIRGLEPCFYEDSLKNWSCSACRRQGPGEASFQPSRT